MYVHKAVYILDYAELYKSLTSVSKQNLRMKYKIIDLQLIRRRNNLREHSHLQHTTCEF